MEESGCIEQDRRRVEGVVDLLDRNAAAGVANEGGNDARRAADIRLQPVFAGEGGRIGDAHQLLLQLGDFFLDLVLVDAVFRGSDQLLLDFLDDFNRGIHTGIGGVNLGGTEAESVFDGGEGHVVGAHGGRDRPVSSVVGRATDAQARGNARLRVFHAAADGTQGFKRGHGRNVGKNARHKSTCP